jgi:hypothetical protein
MKWIIAFLFSLLTGSVNAQGLNTVLPATCATPSALSIPVSTFSNGAASANSLGTGFTNPAETVFTSNFYGAANTKYLRAGDGTQFVFQTTTPACNQSITAFGSNCAFFLNVANGKAWYFRYNYNTGIPTGHGNLTIGIVTGLTTGAIDRNGTFTGIYSNQDLQDTVAGYDPRNTAGSNFTFSVNGFQICAYYNTTQITCFTDYRYAGTPGVAQIQCNTSADGIRDTTVSYPTADPMYSQPSLNIFDVRDFGAKTSLTTGSMSASSNSLTVASPSGFSIGDQIIIATGGEAATGPGTIGVGGALPARTYANLAAANADLGSVSYGTWARLLDTETVIRAEASPLAWVNYIGAIWYQQYADPTALVAHITAITGDTFTLDQSAVTSTTNAKVYFDNGSAYWISHILAAPPAGQSSLTPTNATLNIPAGTFAIYSGPGTATFTESPEKTGWTIRGAGAASVTGGSINCSGCTVLQTPLGVRSYSANLQANNSVLKNLTVQGNLRNSGYVVDFLTSSVSGGGTFLPAHNVTGSNYKIQNVTCIDVFSGCINTSYATNSVASHVTAYLTDGAQSYTQWQFQFSNSTGGGCDDCTVYSPYLIAGFNSFASTNTKFSGITSTNGTFACNSCNNVTFQNLNVTITANSQLSPLSFSVHNGVFDLNLNNKQAPLSSGAILAPFSIVQQGYINATKDSLIFVEIVHGARNWTISGTYPDATSPSGCFQMPDFAGSNPFLGIGVRNDGENTTISGVRFIGKSDYTAGKGNIYAESGSLVATNNVMDSPVTANHSVTHTETGTISNRAYEALHPKSATCP